MKDRIYYGFWAGITASFVRLIFGYAGAYFLTLFVPKVFRWHDFAGVMLFGFTPQTTFELLVAECAVILFEGLLGVAFALLIKSISSSHFIFKGWLFGVTIWFSAFSIKSLFHISGLDTIPATSAVYQFYAASVYGIALTFTTRKIVSTD